MSNKVVKYGSSVDADAIQEAENTAALAKTITTNNSEISPDTLSKIGGTVGYMDSGGNWIGGPGTIKPGSDVDSTPSETPPIQKRNELVINKAENNVFTIDPATGKPVGVITRNQRRELQKRLDAAKKLKNKNISSVLNPTVAQVMAEDARTILSYLKNPNSRYGAHTWQSVNGEVKVQWLPDEGRGWIDIENPKGVKGASGFRKLMRSTLPKLDVISEIPAKWEWNPDDIKKGGIYEYLGPKMKGSFKANPNMRNKASVWDTRPNS